MQSNPTNQGETIMSSHLKGLYRKSRQVLKNDKGQGLVEYALIIVLIAIVLMAALQGLQQKTSTVFSKVGNGLSTGAPQ
jgi:pilus assembly protein Flp/PilA